MKFSSISDLHIREQGDLGSRILSEFIVSEQVQQSDSIYFLGDIFDFMVGSHFQYLEKYKFFFSTIRELIQQGKKVFYIEGNHDFHLEQVMEKFEKTIQNNRFTHSKEYIIEECDSKKFFFSHGHEIDQNSSYIRWKEIYSSLPFKWFVNNLLPYKLVEHLGNKASKDSKKRNMKTFIYNQSQELYREGAKLLINKEKIDFLIK